MAIERDKLTIGVELDSKGAIKNLDELKKGIKGVGKVSKDAGKGISSFDKALDTAFKSMTLLNQGVQLAITSYNTLSSALETVTDAYATQENAQRGLVNTLKLQGQFTREAMQDFTDFAGQLQKTTVVGDEVTLSFLKQAKAMGLSNEQAKNAVTAAANLSAATGRDLNSAFAQTLKTFGGFAGELGEVLPEMKDLTAAQLKAGAATELLNKKFQGEAEALTELFSGSAIQRANAFGDVLEEIGQTFVEVFDLSSVNQDAKVFFENLGKSIKEFREALLRIDFSKLKKDLEEVGMTLSVAILPVLIKMAIPLGIIAVKFTAIAVAIGVVVAALDILVRNLNNLDKVWALALKAMDAAWINFQVAVIKGWEVIIGAAAKFLKFLGKFDNPFGRLAKTAGKALEDVADSLGKNLQDKIKDSKKATEDLADAFADLPERGAIGGIQDGLTEIFRAFDTRINPEIVETQKEMKGVTKEAEQLVKVTDKEIGILKKIRVENRNIRREIELAAAVGNERQILEARFAEQDIEDRLNSFDLETKLAREEAKRLLIEQRALKAAKDRFEINQELNKKSKEYKVALSEVRNEIKLILGDETAQTPFERGINKTIDRMREFAKEAQRNGKLAASAFQKINEKGELKDIFDPGNFKGDSKRFIESAAKLRDALLVLRRLGGDVSIGEIVSNKTSGFLKNADNFIDTFAKDVTTWVNILGTALTGDLVNFDTPEFGIDLTLSEESKKGIKNFVNNTTNFITDSFDVISGAWNAVSSTIGAGMDFFSGATEFIIGFDQAGIDEMKELPGKIAEGMMNIGPMIEAIGTAFSEGVATFLANIGTLLEKLGPIMKEFVSKIGDALWALLDDLPGIIFKFMEAMQPAFTELIKRLPHLVTKIFDAIPEVLDALLSMLPEMLVQVIDILPELIQRIIKGVIGMMGRIIASLIDIFITKGGAVKIAVALVKAIINLVPAIVDGIATGLKNAIGSAFFGFQYPLPSLEPFKKEVEDFLDTVSKGAGKVADEVFSVIDIPQVAEDTKKGVPPEVAVAKAIANAGQKVVGGILGFLDRHLKPLMERLGAGFRNFVESFSVKGFKTFVGKIFKGIGDIAAPIMGALATAGEALFGLLEPLTTAIEAILRPLLEGIANLPMAISESFETLKKFFFEELPKAITGALQGFSNIFATAAKTITDAFQPVVDVFDGLSESVKDAFADPTKLLDTDFKMNTDTAFGDITKLLKTDFKANVDFAFSDISSAFDGLTTPFQNLANALNDFKIDIPNIELPSIDGENVGRQIGTAFSNMTGGLFSPITHIANSLIDVFNGLKIGPAGWRVSAGKLGSWSGTLFPEIDLIPGHIEKFATGGLVEGLFDGSDNQIIAAQPGEFVLRRGAVSGIGEDTVREMNRTGKMPEKGGNVALHINEGAIVVNQQPGESGEEIAEKIFEELKQRSINGETVVFASGIRAE
jgi:phage-related protein